ncbi:MAG: hypothetical protein DI570_09980 [Phenylobacterium zucineum]|nr:MAG: hypothetical protein DI570_09980 [Phenylobacterium zucineum]
MTVGELIQALQKFDAGTRVVMPSDLTSEMVDVARPGLDTIGDIDGQLSLSYLDEPGAQLVVRLFGPQDDEKALSLTPTDDDDLEGSVPSIN